MKCAQHVFRWKPWRATCNCHAPFPTAVMAKVMVKVVGLAVISLGTLCHHTQHSFPATKAEHIMSEKMNPCGVIHWRHDLAWWRKEFLTLHSPLCSQSRGLFFCSLVGPQGRGGYFMSSPKVIGWTTERSTSLSHFALPSESIQTQLEASTPANGVQQISPSQVCPVR